MKLIIFLVLCTTVAVAIRTQLRTYLLEFSGQIMCNRKPTAQTVYIQLFDEYALLDDVLIAKTTTNATGWYSISGTTNGAMSLPFGAKLVFKPRPIVKLYHRCTVPKDSCIFPRHIPANTHFLTKIELKPFQKNDFNFVLDVEPCHDRVPSYEERYRGIHKW